MNIGRLGEQQAAAFFARGGYKILARNYRTRYGEIDLICADAQYVVFVEVKARTGDRFGAPREAVTHAKQQKIIRTAQQWLMEHPTDRQPRFDVAEVWVSPASYACRVVHIADAFEVF